MMQGRTRKSMAIGLGAAPRVSRDCQPLPGRHRDVLRTRPFVKAFGLKGVEPGTTVVGQATAEQGADLLAALLEAAANQLSGFSGKQKRIRPPHEIKEHRFD